MSALAMVRRAIETANNPENGNAGYDLKLTLASGQVIVGPHSGIDATGTWIEVLDRAQDVSTFVLISALVAVAIDW